MLNRLFLNHPRMIGENYGQHFMAAGAFGVMLVGAGFACLIHAFIPGAFISTASDAVERLHKSLVVKRRSKLGQSE